VLHFRKIQLDWRAAAEDVHLDLEQRFCLVDTVDPSGEIRKWTGQNLHSVAQSKDPSPFTWFGWILVHTSYSNQERQRREM
jgi:hypothetical protein